MRPIVPILNALSLLVLVNLSTRCRFSHLEERVDSTRSGPVYGQQIRYDKAEGSYCRPTEEQDGYNWVCLVGSDNAPQAQDEKDESPDETHTEIQQHLHQHFESKFHHTLVSSPGHGTNAHKHSVPHGLPFRKLLPGMKFLPKGILHFKDAHVREQPSYAFSIRLPSRALLSNGGEDPLLLLHVLLISRAERIAGPKPPSCRIVRLSGSPVIFRRLSLRIQVNGIHDSIVLDMLLMCQRSTSLEYNQKDQSQRVGTGYDLVAADKASRPVHHESAELLGSGQDNLLLLSRGHVCCFASSWFAFATALECCYVLCALTATCNANNKKLKTEDMYIVSVLLREKPKESCRKNHDYNLNVIEFLVFTA
jgi:hypothetical protein